MFSSRRGIAFVDNGVNLIVRFRRGTRHQWAISNPVLNPGEPGIDLTLYRMKIGDGQRAWKDLPWAHLEDMIRLMEVK